MLTYLVAGLTILVIGLTIKYVDVKPNHWLGYRTPRSMKSPAHWTFANQRMARYTIIIGMLSIATGMLCWYYKVDSVYLMLFTLLLLLAAVVDVEMALHKFDKRTNGE